MSHDELSPRKAPRQRRSRETVDSILTAAARVFAERGALGATTNHIARAAGVSVGTLYDYFPNKAAILAAVLEREIDAMLDAIRERLDALEAESAALDTRIRSFVRVMLEAHERRPELHRMAFGNTPHPGALHACVLRLEADLAGRIEAMLPPGARAEAAGRHSAAHLAVQVVEALTHRYVEHGLHDLSREDFVEETCRLLRGYLAPA